MRTTHTTTLNDVYECQTWLNTCLYLNAVVYVAFVAFPVIRQWPFTRMFHKVYRICLCSIFNKFILTRTMLFQDFFCLWYEVYIVHRSHVPTFYFCCVPKRTTSTMYSSVHVWTISGRVFICLCMIEATLLSCPFCTEQSSIYSNTLITHINDTIVRIQWTLLYIQTLYR